jgi:hypothetical protein
LGRAGQGRTGQGRTGAGQGGPRAKLPRARGRAKLPRATGGGARKRVSRGTRRPPRARREAPGPSRPLTFPLCAPEPLPLRHGTELGWGADWGADMGGGGVGAPAGAAGAWGFGAEAFWQQRGLSLHGGWLGGLVDSPNGHIFVSIQLKCRKTGGPTRGVNDRGEAVPGGRSCPPRPPTSSNEVQHPLTGTISLARAHAQSTRPPTYPSYHPPTHLPNLSATRK